jgi:hypothetical protein
MMNKRLYSSILLLITIIGLTPVSFSQTIKRLNLDDVLEIAKDQSPQAIMARHRFLGKYWEFRTFKAKYRPALNMNATLADFNRSLEKEYCTGQCRFQATYFCL